MSIATGLRSVAATRYVTALHEGGSLPGLVEADDVGMYVAKFRGAGQGLLALVAEVIVGELARRLDLFVPELVMIEIDPALGLAEPEETGTSFEANAGSTSCRRRSPTRRRRGGPPIRRWRQRLCGSTGS